jgi:hypothetical protein
MLKQGLCAAVLAATCALAADAGADPFVANVTRNFAETVVWQIHGVSARIEKLLMEARTRHDDARALCASDALTRSHSAYRRARVDAAAAKDADARGDVEGVKRAVTRLNGDRDAASKASADVDACFSIARAEDGTSVRLVVDPAVVP